MSNQQMNLVGKPDPSSREEIITSYVRSIVRKYEPEVFTWDISNQGRLPQVFRDISEGIAPYYPYSQEKLYAVVREIWFSKSYNSFAFDLIFTLKQAEYLNGAESECSHKAVSNSAAQRAKPIELR